jgi:hypothetical protein
MKKNMFIIGLLILSGSAYFFLDNTVLFIAGACWGLINLYFIRQLLYGLLLEIPKKPLKIALLALFKFPVLYGLGFGLMYRQDNIPWALIAGFSVVLGLSTQKRFWKAIRFPEMKGMT